MEIPCKFNWAHGNGKMNNIWNILKQQDMSSCLFKAPLKRHDETTRCVIMSFQSPFEETCHLSLPWPRPLLALKVSSRNLYILFFNLHLKRLNGPSENHSFHKELLTWLLLPSSSRGAISLSIVKIIWPFIDGGPNSERVINFLFGNCFGGWTCSQHRLSKYKVKVFDLRTPA